MTSRSNAFISALATAVKLHPRLSAGLAFQLGVVMGVYIRAARGRGGIAGATAKLIDAAPLIPHAPPPARRTVKRKAAAPRKRKTRRKAA
jgi:hypothetical protein